MTNDLITADTETANIIKAATSGRVPFLKFKKGIYYLNADKVDAAFLERRFFAYCGDWRRGWRRWEGEKVIDDRMVRVADDPTDPCPREELGDTDQTKWEPAADDEIRDPWCLENQLPVEDIETGERFIIATPSAGGGIAVAVLCGRWASNRRKKLDKGLPIIKLCAGTFSTKKYKDVPKPEFEIVAWENDDAPDEPVDITPLIDDEIPF
jgi:hypothetical protein